LIYVPRGAGLRGPGCGFSSTLPNSGHFLSDRLGRFFAHVGRPILPLSGDGASGAAARAPGGLGGGRAP